MHTGHVPGADSNREMVRATAAAAAHDQGASKADAEVSDEHEVEADDDNARGASEGLHASDSNERSDSSQPASELGTAEPRGAMAYEDAFGEGA